jgi:N-acyl-D-amino-acid deacylase
MRLKILSAGLAAMLMGLGAISPATASTLIVGARLVDGTCADADLILFDPDAITDHATNAHPEALATGVSRVWVNGAPVYEDGQPTHVFAGRFLKRAATGPIR